MAKVSGFYLAYLLQATVPDRISRIGILFLALGQLLKKSKCKSNQSFLRCSCGKSPSHSHDTGELCNCLHKLGRLEQNLHFLKRKIKGKC